MSSRRSRGGTIILVLVIALAAMADGETAPPAELSESLTPLEFMLGRAPSPAPFLPKTRVIGLGESSRKSCFLSS